MKTLKPSDAEEHISEAAIEDSATNLIPARTLIVATRIALGRAIRPTVACAINQDLKALILGTGIDADFLLYWIGANERVIQDLGSGTTVSGIRLEALHGLPLQMPPAGTLNLAVAEKSRHDLIVPQVLAPSLELLRGLASRGSRVGAD